MKIKSNNRAQLAAQKKVIDLDYARAKRQLEDQIKVQQRLDREKEAPQATPKRGETATDKYSKKGSRDADKQQQENAALHKAQKTQTKLNEWEVDTRNALHSRHLDEHIEKDRVLGGRCLIEQGKVRDFYQLGMRENEARLKELDDKGFLSRLLFGNAIEEERANLQKTIEDARKREAAALSSIERKSQENKIEFLARQTAETQALEQRIQQAQPNPDPPR